MSRGASNPLGNSNGQDSIDRDGPVGTINLSVSDRLIEIPRCEPGQSDRLVIANLGFALREGQNEIRRLLHNFPSSIRRAS
jgi:hypothetical protein